MVCVMTIILTIEFATLTFTTRRFEANQDIYLEYDL